MSWAYVRAAWELTVPAVSGLSRCDVKFVLLALADHADEAGLCWPGVRRLMLFTQLSERTVQRALIALHGLGWVTIRAYAQGGRGRATEYVLTLPVPELSTAEIETHDKPRQADGESLANPVQQTGNPSIPRQKPRQPRTKGRPTRTVPTPATDSETERVADFGAPPTTITTITTIRPALRAGGSGGGQSPAVAGPPRGLGSPSEPAAPDRDRRTTRAAGMLAQLTERLALGAQNGETIFGFALSDVQATLAQEPEQRRTALEKFARWLVAKGAGVQVVRGCVAYSIMRGVENPFAYFAAGQPARIAVEQWAKG